MIVDPDCGRRQLRVTDTLKTMHQTPLQPQKALAKGQVRELFTHRLKPAAERPLRDVSVGTAFLNRGRSQTLRDYSMLIGSPASRALASCTRFYLVPS